MGYRCAYCKKTGKEVTIFSFPKKKELSNIWLKACGLDIHPLNDTSRLKLCRLHFEDSLINCPLFGPKRLKSEAVPTIFNNSDDRIKKEISRKSTTPAIYSRNNAIKEEMIEENQILTFHRVDIKEEIIEEEDNVTIGETGLVENNVNDECSLHEFKSQENRVNQQPKRKRESCGPKRVLHLKVGDFTSPERTAHNLNLIHKVIKQKDKQIRNYIQKCYRLKEKIDGTKNLVARLQSVGVISKDTARILKESMGKEYKRRKLHTIFADP